MELICILIVVVTHILKSIEMDIKKSNSLHVNFKNKKKIEMIDVVIITPVPPLSFFLILWSKLMADVYPSLSITMNFKMSLLFFPKFRSFPQPQSVLFSCWPGLGDHSRDGGL